MLKWLYTRVRWPFWAALGIIVFGCIGMLFEWNKSEWASWVQAVGSVVAIAATGWAVHQAHALAEAGAKRADLADEVRKLSAIASCIFHCRAETESLKRFCAYLPNVDAEMSPLRRQVQMLQSIQLLEVPDWVAAVAVGRAIAAYSYLEEKLRTVEPMGPLQQRLMDDRVGHCKDVIAKFEECELMLQGTLKDRATDVPQQQMTFGDAAVQSLSARDATV